MLSEGDIERAIHAQKILVAVLGANVYAPRANVRGAWQHIDGARRRVATIERALRALQDLDPLEIVEKPGGGMRAADVDATHVECDGGVGEGIAGEIAGTPQVVDVNRCRGGGYLQRGYKLGELLRPGHTGLA